jgi:hypothetical protein
VEVEAREHVTLSWETPLPFPFKLPFILFNLVPYMLRKYDWLSNYINDFKKQLVIYQALPEGGWAK